MTAAYFIEKLQLQKHPEGGYFRETYRSEENILQPHLPKRFHGNRSFATAIYFLLNGNEFSAFHKILSDETWHFYAGSPVTVYMIDEQGNFSQQTIGSNPEKGETFQFTIPANTWFAAEVNDKTGFCLAGCTVTPGFDFADFQLAEKAALLQQFPQHQSLIEKFCVR
jgi:uncharacterized protein